MVTHSFELFDYHTILLLEILMRTSLLFLAALGLALLVGCSQTTSPSVDSAPQEVGKYSSDASIQAGYIKYGDIKGECDNLSDALDVYSGTGTETCALLLPAVQKVRDAAAKLEEEATRTGTVDEKAAEKSLRVMILSHYPTGTAYKLKDVIVTSLKAHGTSTNGNTPDLKPYGKNSAGNIEFMLYHIVNGMRLELDDAGVVDRSTAAAIDSFFDIFTEISDERPEA